MNRIIYMILKNTWYLPKYLFKLFYYSAHVDRYSEQEIYQFLKDIVRKANQGGKVEITVTGEEHIPKESGFMFFPNHQGLYDILAIMDTCPVPFSVVAKKEIKDIPLLKQVLKCMKAFFIDREDVRSSMKIIAEVSKQVKEGKNYLIFPEGTRSRKQNQVFEFKGGSFKAATKAKCPIIPVALIDCYKPFDEKSIKPVHVQVHYLEPIQYEEYENMKTVEIAEEVRKRIIEVIEKKLKK